MACVALLLGSCSSDNEEMDISSLLQRNEEKAKVRSMVAPVVDYSIRNYDATVSNGECVIGVIVYCANKLGRYTERGEIIAYLDARGFLVRNGSYIVGCCINSEDWWHIFDDAFTATYATTQYNIIRAMNTGVCEIVCRINNRTHAVVLNGYSYTDGTFHYYDPVKGDLKDNIVKWEDIRDPIILSNCTL